MRQMIKAVSMLFLLACASVGYAQSPAPMAPAPKPANIWTQTTGPAVYGTVNMDYQTRQNLDTTVGDGTEAHPSPFLPGFTDTYTINIRAGTVGFVGAITCQPPIKTKFTVKQKGHMDFALATGIITNMNLDPAKPVQSKDMRVYGMWAGVIPITEANTYLATGAPSSPQRFSIKSVGNDSAFQSPFAGTIVGRQVHPKTFSWNPMTIVRHYQGKDMQIPIAQPDPMTFEGIVLGAGPRQTYSAVTVGGQFIYARDTGDYVSDANSNPLKFTYTTYDANGSHDVTDTITGTMHFDGSTQKTDNKSHYDVDLRWNDKAPSTDDSQAAAAPTQQVNTDDNAAATTAGSNEHSLHGHIDFLDTPPFVSIVGVDEPSPYSTAMTISLDRTNLTNAQTVAWTKWFIENIKSLTDE